tara:strand:- start:1179 stop:1622 length:444 start_codon:yes stop_codon:yes gene_type:complete
MNFLYSGFKKKTGYALGAWICFLFGNCTPLPENAPSNRLTAADRALEVGDIDKETYFRIVIGAELEQGRENFENKHFLMARSRENELLLDPPVHTNLYKRLEDARKTEEISEDAFKELWGYVRILQSEWNNRRAKVSKERFRWGYPR